MYYHSPLYHELAKDPRLAFRVIYTSDGGLRPVDHGFARDVSWDIDLLEGHQSEFVSTAGRNPISGSALSVWPGDILARLLRARPEVLWIHGYAYFALQLANWLQRVLRRPVLVREEQTLFHSRSFRKTLAKEVMLRMMLRGAHGLYIGTENRRWFEHYGVPDERLFFAGYHVDNDRLSRAAASLEPEKRQLRERFGIPETAGPIVVTVSRLIPKKQPLHLLEGFRRARRRAACTLLIVGSGPEEAALRERVVRDDVPDVYFAGFLNQSEVPQAYACADVFALVSKEHETWGLVVNEAMNFGLPIVVSDKVGCATDLVSRGRNGSVVCADDPEGLADRLVELVTDPERRCGYGRASREIVASWNAQNAAEGVMSAVRGAVGPGRWRLASPTGP